MLLSSILALHIHKYVPREMHIQRIHPKLTSEGLVNYLDTALAYTYLSKCIFGISLGHMITTQNYQDTIFVCKLLYWFWPESGECSDFRQYWPDFVLCQAVFLSPIHYSCSTHMCMFIKLWVITWRWFLTNQLCRIWSPGSILSTDRHLRSSWDKPCTALVGDHCTHFCTLKLHKRTISWSTGSPTAS